MIQHLVASTIISHIGFATDTLRVWFKDGSVWDYHDVAPSVFAEMKDADSVGKFFHANVKGKYKATKVPHG